MKKVILLVSLSSLLILSSCYIEDDTIAVSSLSQVFETTVSFTNSNGYSQLVDIPADIQVYESDVILVYWLEDVISDGGSDTFDVWTPLPQTIYTNQGSFQYSYNHTFIDVFLCLQGDKNSTTLDNNITKKQNSRNTLNGEDGDTKEHRMQREHEL